MAILGGLLIGNHAKGNTLAEFLQDPKRLLLAIGLMVVLVPLMYFLSSKMNQYAYGKLIEDLQNNIRRMEDLA